MKLRLLLIGPNNKTLSQIIYQQSIRLGSNPDCEVVVPPDISPLVSRYHALIDVTDDGVFITDINSTNGTYLNGSRLTERTRLHASDEARLGQNGPIVRAFAIHDEPGSEGTLQDLEQGRPLPMPNTPAPKPHLPPPPPFAISGPPPAPTSKAYQPQELSLPPTRRISHDRDRDDRNVADRPRYPTRESKSKKWWLIGGGGGIVVAAVIGILIWKYAGKSKKEPDGPLSSEEIYKRAVASSTFVVVHRNAPAKSTQGSGNLIDRERMLVLTAYHVVANEEGIKVAFPKYKDGKLVTSIDDYARGDFVTATIWKTDKTKDLAILKLESVPADAKVIPLADGSPEPGEEVHTVGGNPAESIGLWIYSKGNVREVQKDQFKLETGQLVNSWVIRATNPINPGDSGGGLVNKKCELVGVCCAIVPKADAVRTFIDVREVKALLGPLPGAKVEPKSTGVDPKKPETKVAPNPTGIDPRKLIGKWTPEKGVEVEFTRDGSLVITDGVERINGRYRLDKDKLTITLTNGGKEKSTTITAKSLTDDRLVTVDAMGKEEEMKRVK